MVDGFCFWCGYAPFNNNDIWKVTAFMSEKDLRLREPDLWNKYLVQLLNAAKYEGLLRGILSRLRAGESIVPEDGFLIKQIEDSLTPKEYNVKM